MPIMDGSGTGGRLEAVEVFDGLAGMGGSGKNCPLVVLQHLEPVGDVGRMVVPDLRRDVQVGTKEGRSQLRTELHQWSGARWFSCLRKYSRDDRI